MIFLYTISFKPTFWRFYDIYLLTNGIKIDGVNENDMRVKYPKFRKV
jgi:hypothetical protein